MPPRNFRSVVCVAVVALLVPAEALRAVAAEQPAIEPRAAEILSAALTHLAGSASLTLRAEVLSETTLPSGQKLQYPGTLEIALRRPDRLWYRLESEQRRVAAWYDGKEFTLLDSEKNVCASMPALPGLGPLFDDMAARLRFRPPLSLLLREDSAARVLKRIASGYVVGRGEVGGTVCHHLAFRQESVDLQLWVAAAGAPLIKRLVITRKMQPAAPQLSYTIVSWDLNAALGDALFKFEPPQNAVRCEFQTLVE